MEFLTSYWPIFLIVLVVIGLVVKNNSGSKRKSSGSVSTENSNLSVRPLSKNGTFIWKPKSDGVGYGGNLAIILPKGWKTQIATVNGERCYDGKYSAELSGRQVWRTNRPGGSYPNNTVISLDNGKIKRRVPHPAQRYGRSA